MTHFEMGVACLKNGFLRNSKDYIEEEEEIHYLKLAKQEEERKWSENTAGISKKMVAMDSLSGEEEDGRVGLCFEAL